MKELTFEKMEKIHGGKRGDFGCNLAAISYMGSVGLMIAFPPAGMGPLLIAL